MIYPHLSKSPPPALKHTNRSLPMLRSIMFKNLVSIRSILLTTDLSTEAANAYELAASLMEAYQSSLTLLTCIDTSPHYSETSLGILEAPPTIPPQYATEAYANISGALKECLAEHFDQTRATFRIVEAPIQVKYSITNFISEIAPDLVIMSSHGRAGIARALLGSVTEHVLRHCKRPVLVVPSQPR
jgi:nucleotide-binding universal stress UspA family protein